MIGQVFSSNRLLVSYTTGFVFALLVAVWQQFGAVHNVYTGGGQLLMDWLLLLPTPVHFYLNAGLITLGGILFNQLLIDARISQAYDSRFFLAYLLFSFTYPGWSGLQPIVFVALFFVMIIRNMMLAGNSARQYLHIFDAGLFGGLAFLIYQPAWVLFPISLVILLLGGFFSIKTFILWLLGYGTPLYLLAAGLYLADSSTLFYQLFDFHEIDFVQYHAMDVPRRLSLSLAATLFLGGVGVSFTKGNLKTNALRNAQRIFFILLLTASAAIVLTPGDGLMTLGLFAPVAAFYMGRFIEQLKRGWMLDAIILFFLILLVLGSGIF